MSHLKNALDELLAEQEVLVDQQKRLASKLTVVQQGIESLSHLLADSDVSNPAPQPLTEDADLNEVPLWRHIAFVLENVAPMRPRDIADSILSMGYETTSKDFPNVIGTNLRAYPNKFKKLEDGRWDVIRLTAINS